MMILGRPLFLCDYVSLYFCVSLSQNLINFSFAHIVNSTGEIREKHLATIVQKLAKPAFKPYYRIRETQKGKEYLFTAGHPSGENQAEIEDKTMRMVANYCSYHGTERLDCLTDLLGIENQVDLPAISWLGLTLEAAHANKPIFIFGGERGPNMSEFN